MLFGAKNEVVYGVRGRTGGPIGHAGGAGQAVRNDAARLEALAAIWSRQTGRQVVVARGAR
jgi:hypothetical protein